MFQWTRLSPFQVLGSCGVWDAVHVFRLVPLLTKAFRSVGGYDGYVVESNETSGVGLLKDSALPYVRVGDDEKKRQFRSILAFNTGTLHDTAMITTALVKVKKNYATAGNIFTQLGILKMDIRMPYFGQQLNLESNDFSAVASKESGCRLCHHRPPWVGTAPTYRLRRSRSSTGPAILNSVCGSPRTITTMP